MEKAVVGLIISAVANVIYAARNFFGKGTQLALTAAATVIWLLEYSLVFHSATYTLIMSFILIYLIAYRFRRELLRFFKADVTFLLMVLFIGIAIAVAIITYEGKDSILGIVIMFLELFSVYMFSAQGLRYKNGLVSIMYCILDFSIGNFFVAILDLVNFVVPVVTLIKHRKEKILDREGLKEYIELIKVTREARREKKRRTHDSP